MRPASRDGGEYALAEIGSLIVSTPPTWDDLAWIREQWPGPLVLKGIMRADDAERAAALGADGISVSNHGAKVLDGTPAALAVLPEIVDAVGHKLDVLLDGGVRRGADVVRACALGAEPCSLAEPTSGVSPPRARPACAIFSSCSAAGFSRRWLIWAVRRCRRSTATWLRPLPSQSHWNELGERLHAAARVARLPTVEANG